MSDWLGLDQISSTAAGMPGRPAAWLGGECVRRARFLQDVGAWQAAFAIRPGARFALFLEHGAYTFATALFGAWQAGKIVYLPGNMQPATLARLQGEVHGFAGDFPESLAPVRPAAQGGGPLRPLDLQATGLVIYTSGSSGEPVAIHKRLAQLDAEVHALETCFGAALAPSGEGECVAPRTCSSVSHQHIYGLLFQVLWPLAAGRAFDDGRLLYPEQMAARLGPGPSVLVGSPALLKRLPDTLDWSVARAGLRAVFSSGGPLPKEAADACAVLSGRAPVEIFGSSETGGIAWRRRAFDGGHDGGSERWSPLPGVAWRVEPDGLLGVRSPHLPDDDWFATGDRVQSLGEHGFVLLGRADRIVKIEEKRLSLTAVESAALALPEIAQARALVLPGAGGDRVALVAVLTPLGRGRLASQGRRGLADHLRESLRAEVEPLGLPRRWRYVQALPADTQGKHTGALLSALFRPRVPAGHWLNRDAARARVELEVTADLAVFDGHFDCFPVLPGVAQLDWAIGFARSCFVMPPRFLRAEALKFQKPVLPPIRLLLDLQWDAATGRLVFSLVSALGTHAVGRAVFGPDTPDAPGTPQPAEA